MNYEPLAVEDLRTKAEMNARHRKAVNRLTLIAAEKERNELLLKNNRRRMKMDGFLRRWNRYRPVVPTMPISKPAEAPPAPFLRTRHLTTQNIIEAVCRLSGLTQYDLLSVRRSAHCVYWRQIGIALTRKHTSLSYPQIGRQFGNRDHSTVIHSVRQVAKRAKPGDVAGVERLLGLADA